MVIERPDALEKLVASIGSSQVKVVTGLRRCGKSFLLFTLFKQRLLDMGVPEGNIFEMAFDRYGNKRYRDPELFYAYANEWLSGATGACYLLLDEVQLLGDFSAILIDLASRAGVDVYATGSNAHLLSKDVVTEFRGRSREIHLSPLSFSEFMSAYNGDKRDGYAEYATYGGLPAIFEQKTPEAKAEYLSSLYEELYLSDIVERNGIRNPECLEDLADVLSSGIGSLTNAAKISASFKSAGIHNASPGTIENYISCLEDSYLVRKAKRHDVKGRKYIGAPLKYYFTDVGLRNARMNFRQMEETHLMENVIYNELVGRGFGVDVGVVALTERDASGRQHRKQLEIDFVCNRGSERYYVQSAFALPTQEKEEQERRSLEKVGDGFKKVIVTKEGLAPHYDQGGILRMSVYDFLLDRDSLSR